MKKNNIYYWPIMEKGSWKHFLVQNKLGLSQLEKAKKEWSWVNNNGYENATGLSIQIANLNLRKIEMLMKNISIKITKQQKHTRIISGNLRHIIFKKDNYRCVECGISNKESVLHIDHIKPWSKGGLTELNNLQTLCRDCNLAKHTQEWVGGK